MAWSLMTNQVHCLPFFEIFDVVQDKEAREVARQQEQLEKLRLDSNSLPQSGGLGRARGEGIAEPG